MRLNLSRHLQPYGFFRRFPIAERPRFVPEHAMRYADILHEFASHPPVGKDRARLLGERASIEELAGRIEASRRSLSEGIELASNVAPAQAHELRYQEAKLLYRNADFAHAQTAIKRLLSYFDLPASLRSRSLLLLGRVGLDQGRFSSAIEAISTGLEGENTPHNIISGHFDLVYAYFHEIGRDPAYKVLTIVEGMIEPGDRIGQAAVAYYRGWLDFRKLEGARASLEFARAKTHDLPTKDPGACCELTLAFLEFRCGRVKECLASCERVFALTVGPDSRPDFRLCAQLLRGRALMIQGSYITAIEQFQTARDSAAHKKLPILESRACEGLADVHILIGELLAARRATEEGLRLSRAAGDPLRECIGLLNLAMLERLSGAKDLGLAALKQGEEIALHIGNRIEQARAKTEFAEFCISNGDFASAEIALADAQTHYQTMGSLPRLAMIMSIQAKVLSLRDRQAEALERITNAEQTIANDPCHIFLAEVLAIRADVLEDCGDRESPRKLLSRASDLASQCGANALGEEFRRAVEAVQEREFARQLLERYLDARVVARLLARPERRIADSIDQVAAILFSDIRGYTTLSEKLSPHEVVSMLNEHFGAMSEEVQHFGGVIDKFIGDAIMVVFGDPGAPRFDDAARAVQAAVAMVRRREIMNAFRATTGLPPIHIGVGVHVGPIIMGHIGSRHRLSYTVIGDTVNVAARLESATKEYNRPILISEDVAQSPNQFFPVESIGEVSLKGRTRPVRVFAVHLEKDS